MCRKINNLKEIPNNTKHKYPPLHNDYYVPCIQIIEAIRLTKSIEIDNDGNVIKFESTIPFSHPKRHYPPTNLTNDMNISPVEGSFVAVTHSM